MFPQWHINIILSLWGGDGWQARIRWQRAKACCDVTSELRHVTTARGDRLQFECGVGQGALSTLATSADRLFDGRVGVQGW